jgi:hypothetical protein
MYQWLDRAPKAQRVAPGGSRRMRGLGEGHDVVDVLRTEITDAWLPSELPAACVLASRRWRCQRGSDDRLVRVHVGEGEMPMPGG